MGFLTFFLKSSSSSSWDDYRNKGTFRGKASLTIISMLSWSWWWYRMISLFLEWMNECCSDAIVWSSSELFNQLWTYLVMIIRRIMVSCNDNSIRRGSDAIWATFSTQFPMMIKLPYQPKRSRFHQKIIPILASIELSDIWFNFCRHCLLTKDSLSFACVVFLKNNLD